MVTLLVAMVGWTAPLLALSLLVIAVFSHGDRAGSWSIEGVGGGDVKNWMWQAGRLFVWFNPISYGI